LPSAIGSALVKICTTPLAPATCRATIRRTLDDLDPSTSGRDVSQTEPE
jgi:hypothetical protein